MRIMFSRKMERRDVLKGITQSGVYDIISDIIKQNKAKKQGLLFPCIVKNYINESHYGSPKKLGDTSETLRYNYMLSISNGKMHSLVTDEQSRLNINALDVQTIAGLLEKKALLTKEPAQEIAYNIVDWRDEDNERPELNLINNEDLYYELSGMPYKPKNKPYELIEELLLVKGVTQSMLDDIEPFLTVYGNGMVNINTCSKSVLEILGLDSAVAGKIISYREGMKLSSDKSDKYFESLDSIIPDLKEVVGLIDEEESAVRQLLDAGRITVDSEIFRINGIGSYLNEYARTKCVVNKAGKIKYWNNNYTNL